MLTAVVAKKAVYRQLIYYLFAKTFSCGTQHFHTYMFTEHTNIRLTFVLRLLDNGYSGKEQHCCVGHVTMTNSA